MYCICCKKNNVIPDDCIKNSENEEDILWGEGFRSDHIQVSDGVIHKFDVGYGTKYDGDRLIVAICENCMDDCINIGILIYKDNYLFHGESFIEDDINKSKVAYRRRKNLDNLI